MTPAFRQWLTVGKQVGRTMAGQNLRGLGTLLDLRGGTSGQANADVRDTLLVQRRFA
jgi:hypothetical protein